MRPGESESHDPVQEYPPLEPVLPTVACVSVVPQWQPAHEEATATAASPGSVWRAAIFAASITGFLWGRLRRRAAMPASEMPSMKSRPPPGARPLLAVV